MRYGLLTAAMAAILLVATSEASPRPAPTQDSLPPEFVPSGKLMFRQYCAACHGLNAKGHGPARSALKTPAADLTTLSKRHGAEFPYDYVSNILRFGPGVAAQARVTCPPGAPSFNTWTTTTRPPSASASRTCATTWLPFRRNSCGAAAGALGVPAHPRRDSCIPASNSIFKYER